MRILRIVVLGAVFAVIAAAGCSKPQSSNPLATGLAQVDQLAPKDTTPGPPNPPGPPPPPVIQPVQFLGADSAGPGQTCNTYWRLGNDLDRPFTMQWSVDMGPGWPGDPWPAFPIVGEKLLPPTSTRDITVPIAVPATAFDGVFPVRMTVGVPGGTTTADGQIRVFSDIPPPEPTPPPMPAVSFAGWDSLAAQPTIGFWMLHNESDAPFTMQWSLASSRNWPGFPITGSQDIHPQGNLTIAVTVPIPDTAAVGFNRMFMTVTRPNGLPPQTAEADLPIVE